jgi:hypothetical protein
MKLEIRTNPTLGRFKGNQSKGNINIAIGLPLKFI